MSGERTDPQSGSGSVSRIPTIGAAEYVGRDRAALARGDPSFQLAVLTGEALTLGVSQAEEAPIARRARELGVEVVRRSSGGTAVLTGPGDLAWSIVLPREDPRVGRDYARAYGRLGGAVADALGTLGPRAEWGEAPALSEELCLLGPRGQVLRWQGRVVGGAAQHRTSSALLHHGVLLGRVDAPRTSRIGGLPESTLTRELAGVFDLTPGADAGAFAAELGRRLAEFVGR